MPVDSLKPPRVDWGGIVLALRRAGLNYERQGALSGASPETIGHLARNEVKEPRFSVGHLLLALHERHCPDRHAQQAFELL